MSDTAITGQRKTSIGFLLPVQITGGPEIDLTLAGTRIDVTVKKRRSDANAVIHKSYIAPATFNGVTPVVEAPPGITNVADVEIAPADTDPATYAAGEFKGLFDSTAFLVWDAILTEPGGRVTKIAQGAFTVRAGVGS